MRKLVFFHLLNDYSGSPKVLSDLIKSLVKYGYSIELYTSRNKGFLSDIDGIQYHVYPYKWTSNKLPSGIRLLYAQLYIFIAALKRGKERDVVFYMNSICPIGAAFGTKLLGNRLIYQLHEKYLSPNIVHRIYEAGWNYCSEKTVFVSEYLKQKYLTGYPDKKGVVIHNALSPDFINQVKLRDRKQPDTIIMVASLKKYKGVDIFVELAKRLPQYKFTLILNATQKQINDYFKEISDNLKIYPVKTNITDDLYKSDLLVNLSVPSEWIETFGLTLLEAMSFGLPVIAPPVGGPVELVEDNYNGYLIDSRNIELLSSTITRIFTSGEYSRLSDNALRKAEAFNSDQMLKRVIELIEE